MQKMKKIGIIILTSILAIISMTAIIINIYQANELKHIKIQDENIVFFGDSITEGYNVKEFFDDNNVVNSGVSGNQTSDLLENIESRLYDYNPSKVIILIGINDIHKDKDDNEIIDNLTEIIENIKENRKNAEIYVQSVYPINSDLEDASSMFQNKEVNNERVKSLNKKIEKLCKAENITYIYVYDDLIDENGNLKSIYTKDGVHLTDLGYHKVTEVLKKYVNEN